MTCLVTYARSVTSTCSCKLQKASAWAKPWHWHRLERAPPLSVHGYRDYRVTVGLTCYCLSSSFCILAACQRLLLVSRHRHIGQGSLLPSLKASLQTFLLGPENWPVFGSPEPSEKQHGLFLLAGWTGFCSSTWSRCFTANRTAAYLPEEVASQALEAAALPE